jgi:hypothetical protein
MIKHQSNVPAFEYEAHGPWITSGGKKWCFSCGHVSLNNTISRWVDSVGCNFRDHPSYKNRLKKAGGQNGSNS